MPLTQIPFTARVNKNVDEMATSGNTVDMIDCYMDELGYINRRPGLEVLSTISGAGRIDGVYYWDEKLVTIAVSAGIVYSVDQFGNATQIGSGLLADGTVTFSPAKIAGADVLAMANGNGVFTTDGITVTQQAGAPSDCTHVAFIDRYLLANDPGTGLFYWSALNDPTDWPASNFAEFEREPDNLLALHVQGSDIVGFGYRSIEFYYNDGQSPFRRYQGGEVSTGVSVAYSIKFVPEINAWLYLDENRHLVMLKDRIPVKVSGPYDDELQDLTEVDDGVASICRVGGRGWYIINFPTENVTFVYDYQQEAWYKWGNWNSEFVRYDRFLCQVMTYDTRTRAHIAGSTEGGFLYSMSKDVYTDNGDEIRSNVRTGFIDHGTQNRKKSKKVRFRMKRGVAKDASDTAGSVIVKYRDDYTGSFGNEVTLSTGIGGDSNFTSQLRLGGIYVARQWDITSSDNTPFIIGGFEEEVKVLRN